MAKRGQSSEGTPYLRAMHALGENFGQLGLYLASARAEQVYKFTLRQRSQFDWVATLVVWDDSGKGRRVAFGNGADSVGCLLALAGAIAADNWREDQFYDPSDGDS